jgi:hypothetical protein
MTKKMTDTEKVKIYNQYLPMVYRMAGRFSRVYGMPFQDMVDEGQSILGRLAATWDSGKFPFDPAKANATSWVYRNLFWDLTTLCSRACKNRAIPFSSLEREDRPIDLPSKSSWMDNLLREVGEDAKILLQTILDAPAEITEDVFGVLRGKDSTPYRSRRVDKAWDVLQSYLVSCGWEPNRIDAAWHEVEVSL